MKDTDKHLKKSVWLMGLIIGWMLITGGVVSASLGTFKQNDCVDIKTILNTTAVTISSLNYPNSSKVLGITSMTKTGLTFNYTFCNTSTSGRYNYDYNDSEGNVYVNDFEINPAGVESTQSRTDAVSRSIWFLFAVSLVLFIGFLFVKSSPPAKWTFFLISMMFFLQAVNILFVGLQDEVVNPKIESYFSFLATSSFILFWFAFGILGVLWIVTTFQTILFNKKQRQKEQFGG
ncbi:MAG: hypothetical protein IMZ60_00160 [Actinobacteria bacterium]|nr:hypothetical protein [Actinomycetota bacterium]